MYVKLKLDSIIEKIKLFDIFFNLRVLSSNLTR